MTDPERALRRAMASNSSRTRIRWPDDLADDDTSTEQKRRAAIVVGHLLQRDRNASHSPPDLLAETAYGAALVSPQGQRKLGDLSGAAVLGAHTYACIFTERRGHTISLDQEASLFAWLCEQAELGLDEPLRARMIRQRERRHALLAQPRKGTNRRNRARSAGK